MTHLLRLLVLALCLVAGGPAAAQLPSIPGISATTQTPESEPETPTMGEGERASIDDLIRILESDVTRARLVESLRAMAYRPAEGEEGGAAAQEDAGDIWADEMTGSLPATLARYTRSGVEAAQGALQTVAGLADASAELLSGTQAINLPRIYQAVAPVFAVAVAVFGAYFLLSLALRPVFDWIAARAKPGRPLRKLGLLASAFVVSAGKILLSALAGHVAAFIFFAGPPNLNQALFLNAFLLVGGIKVALSAFVAPYHPPLRMTPFGDRQARYWYGRLALLISLLGYTFLFVAPVVEANSNMRAANSVRFIVVTAVFVIMLSLILRNRVTVRERLQRSYLAGDRSFQAQVNMALGHVWVLGAAAFVCALYALWLSSPEDGLQFMIVASLRSLAAITIGGLVITLLSKLILRGIRIPQSSKDRFPLLERRVNTFIPKLLLIVRIVVILLVFGSILNAWALLDLASWATTPLGQRFISGGAGALLVLCIGVAVYLVVSSWVEYRLNPNYGTVPTARERTLLSLFRNAFTVTLLVLVLMSVLSQLGIDIAPLLAGAGVVGLAIGFGAQKLVQDIITGAFLQIENVMNEGDVVEVAGIAGVVEKLTIRSVSLRSLDGTYHLIPFSAVDQVSNMTKDFSNFVADVSVSYREDIGEVKAAMREAFDILREGEQGMNVIDDFEIFGVETIGNYTVTVRGRMRTLPGTQWSVGRAYREIVKRTLDRRGIEIPLPQTTLWFGSNKDGSAPPLHFMRDREAPATILTPARETPGPTGEEAAEPKPPA
ncbi:mechanosensitive ion channel domain-containing protein [Aureimonas populi]|nr:mechanosensitive ion channel domain-containing protein [Aureimonas populi]